MIYSLNGKLIYSQVGLVVVECSGVGFKCSITVNTNKQLPAIGENVFIYTYMNVREDAMDLFGFMQVEELECFKMLIGVNGVGPKVAISVLSELTPSKLALAIASGDSKSITKAQGIGPKIAQRIVLELKDKIKNISSNDEDNSSVVVEETSQECTSEAISALITLGYSRNEAASVVAKIDPNQAVEDIIMQALRLLARQV